jgi:hypothetical protein
MDTISSVEPNLLRWILLPPREVGREKEVAVLVLRVSISEGQWCSCLPLSPLGSEPIYLDSSRANMNKWVIGSR